MNGIRTLLYICALIGLMPYAHEIEGRAPLAAQDNACSKVLEIIHSGKYQICYLNNQLVLVDTDNEHRLYNLQAAIQPGSFSISANVNNQFVIAADNVEMDLSGYRVQGGIVVAPNRSDIKIANGLIGGRFASSLANGILVYSGCRNITIDGIQITNAIAGINFTNVTTGLINNCDLSQNTTGVLLQGSSQIVVNESCAMQNVAAGFSLINSSTNCLRDCQALSTGQGNTKVINNQVIGFLSTNGFGNIFERCIANSTQALSTTDFNSVIAGFALRGSEGCTKIIECEAANAIASPSGVTVPYGILLEATLDNPITLTAGPIRPSPTEDPEYVAWSPDGKYFASLGEDTGIIRIYYFDRTTFIATQVATYTLQEVEDGQVVWSPSGQFLAAGNNPMRILEFDRINNSLTVFATLANRGSRIAWSPDEQFLAVRDSGSDFSVVKFDRVSGSITVVDTETLGATVQDILWSPGGTYIITADNFTITLFSFISNTLVPVDSVTIPNLATVIRKLDISSDGQYIAGTSSEFAVYDGIVFVYRISTMGTLEFVTDFVTTVVNFPIEIVWSPDGRYLALGGTPGVGGELELFQFDPGVPALFSVSGPNITPQATVRALDWSPDGQFLLVGDDTESILIYQTLSFPSKNVIKDNTVYCNSTGGSYSRGIGISGSSIANMVIQNTAYANPITPFMVTTNYAFVQNVFNQQFGQGPTSLQNISLGYQIPINTPDNIALILQQINAVLSSQLLSDIDIITNEIGNIFSGGNSCAATSIKQVNVPTTLSASGSYCLAEDISLAGQLFTISASNVILDLNNHKITNASTSNVVNVVGPVDTITIKNGVIEQTVDGGTSINATTGAVNLTLENLIIKSRNGLAVDLAGVTNGLISDCIFTSCQRGIRMTNCSNIACNDTQARDCSLKGFELITSTTCEFQNCKAIGTGVGNTQTSNQIIAGFYSSRGSANIFENCIANGTQGLSVTDFDSVVAGFMLTSTESCTKIINCESSNATVGANSYTTPYGILLQNQLTQLFEVDNTVDSFLGVLNLSWSPNGKYLAVAIQSGGNPQIFILKFDRLTRKFIQLASISPITITQSAAAVWSPDGQYIAMDLGYLYIYKFDQYTETVSLFTEINLGGGQFDTMAAIAWSPDSRYLAVGGDVYGSLVDFYMFEYNPVAQTFTQRATLNVGATINAAAWSPDGKYITIAPQTSSLYQYEWDRVNNQLILRDTESASFPQDVDWSPDGRYLVMGNNPLSVFSLNQNTGALTLAASLSLGGDVYNARWSPDGRYIAAAGLFSGNDLVIYQFNRATNAFNLVTSVNMGGNTTLAYSVGWTPDGNYLAAGRFLFPSIGINDLFMYAAFDFPQQCVVKDNVVYCNAGGIQSQGVGISGSSTSNLIMGNTAYANPITPYMVNANYNFVTNVFNPIFENMPALFENISLGYQQPIAIPENEAFLAQQLLGIVDDLGACGPTSLTANSVVSGTISITVGGNYCLATDLTTDISLTATCITLDLNNRILTGVITIATSDNTTVQNGFVEPPERTSNADPAGAINVNSTALRTTIANLVIRCANSSGDAINGRSGVFIQGADTLVSNCNITPGNASSASSGPGAIGGHGIDMSVTFTVPRTIIKDCIIYTGNGGSTGAGVNPGGSGGHGVNVANGLNTSIANVIVFATGNGGNGFGGGVGGSGGNGIKISSYAVDTQVFNCVLRNTGLGGSPSGANGKAIDDDVTVTANLSQIFSNIAYNISSATKFDLQASGFERGTLIPNPPGQSVFNILANVFTS